MSQFMVRPDQGNGTMMMPGTPGGQRNQTGGFFQDDCHDDDGGCYGMQREQAGPQRTPTGSMGFGGSFKFGGELPMQQPLPLIPPRRGSGGGNGPCGRDSYSREAGNWHNHGQGGAGYPDNTGGDGAFWQQPHDPGGGQRFLDGGDSSFFPMSPSGIEGSGYDDGYPEEDPGRGKGKKSFGSPTSGQGKGSFGKGSKKGGKDRGSRGGGGGGGKGGFGKDRGDDSSQDWAALGRMRASA